MQPTFSDNTKFSVKILKNVVILGQNFEVIICTRSDVNMGSYDIYIALGLPKLHENYLTLSGISGSKETPLGFITVNIEKDNYVVNINLYIANSLNHDIILGNNFLKQLNVDISEKGLQIVGKRKLKKVRINNLTILSQGTADRKINVSAILDLEITRHCGQKSNTIPRLKKLLRTPFP